MSANLSEALNALVERIAVLAADDDRLRAELRRTAEAVLDALGPEGPSEELQAGEPAVVEEQQEAAVVDEEPIPASELIQALWPARVRDGQEADQAAGEPSSATAWPARWTATSDSDLSVIQARCHLKAEGARWAAMRQRRMLEGADFKAEIEPRDHDLISRAKELPDCFLWMNHPSGPSPANLRLYEDVAGCFEAVADAISVIRQILDDPDSYQNEYEHGLDVLAEAQSALRVAIGMIDGPTDRDQIQVFNWLKTAANENQVFIQRYMRSDDPADPSQWSELASRIEALDSRLQETRRRVKERRKLLGKIRHKLSLIAGDPQDSLEHWRILAATVDELIAGGLPPSNRELRELLLRAIDELPELPETPKGFQLVLREIDHYMATCPPTETTVTAAPATAEVRETARLLRGRSVVLIGGDRRPPAHQALKDAFHLQDLIWISTREHQSIYDFEPYVARPDVAVVLLAIRWSSHSFGEVKEFCERHGKLLVRLPAGYNPNQVAAQVMAQCSDRLK